jgi:hypothetical protein
MTSPLPRVFSDADSHRKAAQCLLCVSVLLTCQPLAFPSGISGWTVRRLILGFFLSSIFYPFDTTSQLQPHSSPTHQHHEVLHRCILARRGNSGRCFSSI